MEAFVWILGILLVLKWLFNMSGSLLDKTYIPKQCSTYYTDQIIQEILNNIHTEQLEQIKQELVERNQTYQDLQTQLARSSAETNFFNRLNPFSTNPHAIEWRNSKTELNDITNAYNLGIEQINHEIELATKNMMPICLMCISTDLISIIEDLHGGIRNLSATGSYGSSFASVHGKGRLLDTKRALITAQARLNEYIVGHFGEKYNQYLKRGDITAITTRYILRSLELPDHLK